MVILLYSCKEDEKGQYPIHSNSPGKVTSARVEENVPGGAVIVYDIPSDKDAMYVRARYALDDGTPMELKSSVYTNKITIVGIGRSREVAVTLTVVDRSQNESEPVTIVAYPLDSPIYDIATSMIIQDDFGGISLRWDNPTKMPIVIDVYSPDENGDRIQVDRFYSQSQNGRANVRGQESKETIFEVEITDRWGNRIDPISGTYTPLYEELLDKSKFRRWNPTGLIYFHDPSAGHQIEALWNDIWHPDVWCAASYNNHMCFDMGQLARISRFKVYQTGTAGQLYDFASPKRFEIWGSTHPDVTDDKSGWQLVGYFESYKPSGLPRGQNSDEDFEYAAMQGEDFEVENSPTVRYIWIECLETWGQSERFYMMEMTLWGQVEE